MNTKTRILMALGCALAFCAPVMAAQRTFVSGTGLDANDCALARPCRGFATAMAHTDAYGEIVVLDSAGYGPVTIDKSVSIIAPPGVYAGVSVFSGDGIEVDPGAGGKVVLRGLTINGQGGNVGIRIASGDEIHVERCVISNMSTGIYVPGGLAIRISSSVVRSSGMEGLMIYGGDPRVSIADSSFADNHNDGIRQHSGSLSLDRVRSQHNGGRGLRVAPATTDHVVKAFVRNSTLDGNNDDAVFVTADLGGKNAAVTIERSTLARSGTFHSGVHASSVAISTVAVAVDGILATGNFSAGIHADGPGTVVSVAGSTVTNNDKGLLQENGAVLYTYGDNALGGNSLKTVGTITPISLQ